MMKHPDAQSISVVLSSVLPRSKKRKRTPAGETKPCRLALLVQDLGFKVHLGMFKGPGGFPTPL